mmetsp:Transcript_160511/g.490663  ORF Transcript_160511/g.490663 Transcript_160511/m.490663 type:complete len:235 (-) Transcript_160511:347-1051(-)|eukprot:CAMPEP_0204523496 /NCGR_PEP_ID=MMETSP0661-20131031/6870_1 /ASSEMBLY_ACC=CAM_ASM_000606 /TAXON_ID=109239 /ORGANISM="Alexandrium margalefi, Strain AMGDE01CS-322" /LENGTH=234 /DNA_ID=CAMNT_0051529195 /DNA_START=170 /DNA_END=874 /DNA_ORIENTATION=+
MGGSSKYNALAARTCILEGRLCSSSPWPAPELFEDCYQFTYASAQLRSHHIRMNHCILAGEAIHFPFQALSAVRPQLAWKDACHARCAHRRAARLRHPDFPPARRWQPIPPGAQPDGDMTMAAPAGMQTADRYEMDELVPGIASSGDVEIFEFNPDAAPFIPTLLSERPDMMLGAPSSTSCDLCTVCKHPIVPLPVGCLARVDRAFTNWSIRDQYDEIKRSLTSEACRAFFMLS